MTFRLLMLGLIVSAMTVLLAMGASAARLGPRVSAAPSGPDAAPAAPAALADRWCSPLAAVLLDALAFTAAGALAWSVRKEAAINDPIQATLRALSLRPHIGPHE